MIDGRKTAIAAILTLVAACGREAAGPVPTDGVIRLSEQFTGDFALIDRNGAEVADEDFEGRLMLVYFGFTHCPDVCPGDVGVMSAVMNELGEDAEKVAPIFISVDPERDTPEALQDYFAFDDRIIALTGTPEAAEKARMAFKATAQKQPLPDSALAYTVNHSRFFYICDTAGQPRYAVAGGVGPQELAAIVRRAMEGA